MSVERIQADIHRMDRAIARAIALLDHSLRRRRPPKQLIREARQVLKGAEFRVEARR